MADITPTIISIGDAVLVEWDQINNDDEGGTTGLVDGSQNLLPRYPDKTVAMTGTFNGGTFSLEGSDDNVVYVAAHSAGGSIAAGSALAFTAAGSAVVAQNFRYYRVANNNSGTAEDVNVHLLCNR